MASASSEGPGNIGRSAPRAIEAEESPQSNETRPPKQQHSERHVGQHSERHGIRVDVLAAAARATDSHFIRSPFVAVNCRSGTLKATFLPHPRTMSRQEIS